MKQLLYMSNGCRTSGTTRGNNPQKIQFLWSRMVTCRDVLISLSHKLHITCATWTGLTKYTLKELNRKDKIRNTLKNLCVCVSDNCLPFSNFSWLEYSIRNNNINNTEIFVLLLELNQTGKQVFKTFLKVY